MRRLAFGFGADKVVVIRALVEGRGNVSQTRDYGPIRRRWLSHHAISNALR